MKTSNTTILDLSSLPVQARQEVTDFYLFLKEKYRAHTTGTTGRAMLSGPPAVSLANAGFVGMWKDRPDMDTAAVWVREQRKSAWSRHE